MWKQPNNCIFGQTLPFNQHIKHIAKTAFFHLRTVARLRPSLSFSAAETLTHAFTTSRLGYCSSLIHGSSSKTLKKLQYIQNSAAHLLRPLITPVLHNCHWLPHPTAYSQSSSVNTLPLQPPVVLCCFLCSSGVVY